MRRAVVTVEVSYWTADGGELASSADTVIEFPDKPPAIDVVKTAIAASMGNAAHGLCAALVKRRDQRGKE